MRLASRCITSFVHVLFPVLALAGCSRLSPDEQLLSDAFTCIKQKDFARYKSLTVTSADFDLKRDHVSPFKAKLGYAGGVLKPQIQEQQKRQFEKAVAGGPGIIDFSTNDYLGIDKKVNDNLELIGGGEIPIRVISLKTKTGSNGKSPPPQPLFMVTDWNGRPRILKLLFENQP